MRPEPFKKWTRPFRLRQRLSRHLPSSGGARRLRIVAEKADWRLVELIRERDLLTVVVGRRDAFEDDRCNYYCRAFLPSLVYPMARTAGQGRLHGELGDGSSTVSERMLFSANFAEALLLPDPDFFNSAGYAPQRQAALSAVPWHERRPDMIWRGSTTGDASNVEPPQEGHVWQIQRVSFCRALNGLAGVDAKFTKVIEPLDPSKDEGSLRREGLLGAAVPEDRWRQHKFAFDVDGNTNAWSNLFVRMLFGCCVIKIASPRDFRQWYYDRLVPWVHYVPVEADLADLHERIDWCRSHPDECCNIAMNGRSMAEAMTFDTEMNGTIRRLDARLDQTG